MRKTKTFDSVTGGVVLRLTRRIQANLAQARARKSLRALDDHLLRDIGVSRSEIDYVISGGRRP